VRRLWHSELLTPLSSPARAVFVVIAVVMAVVAVVFFIDGIESSTAPLIFLFLGVYLAIAYALIFLADRLVRFAARR
jgi:protein-S-isoprenylcysteine O-methyltransferase Ste14